MPELPDVEGYRAMLAHRLTGTRVRNVRVLDAGVLRNTSAAVFRESLIGRTFLAPERRGKWLLLATDGPILLIHNGMTGRLYFETLTDDGVEIDRNDRAIITTNRGDLHYADLRKLRGLWIVADLAEAAAVIGEQGTDALEISAPAFVAALHDRRTAVKTALMNQQVVAGLGNMLSDEICWRARLHPARTANALDEIDLRHLHRVMRRTLRVAVAHGRIPRARSWLSSTRDDDRALCPRCRTPLRRSAINGRTSIWCPHCQPAV